MHHCPPPREAKTRTWKQELRQRLWRNTARWLVLYGLLILLFYTTQDQLTRDGSAHRGVGPSTSGINQENVPSPNMPISQSDGGTSSIEVPSFQVFLVCVQHTPLRLFFLRPYCKVQFENKRTTLQTQELIQA